MDPIVIMIAGVILALVGYFVAFLNVARTARSIDKNEEVSVFSIFGVHLIGAACIVIGISITVIGGIIAIFGI